MNLDSNNSISSKSSLRLNNNSGFEYVNYNMFNLNYYQTFGQKTGFREKGHTPFRLNYQREIGRSSEFGTEQIIDDVMRNVHVWSKTGKNHTQLWEINLQIAPGQIYNLGK